MSTIYRAVVTCDEQRTTRCHGLITVEDEPKALADQATATLAAKGWLRGYAATQTYDTCPACRPLTGGPPAGRGA